MTLRHRHVHRDWRDDARAWREQMEEDARKWHEDAKDWADSVNPFSDSNSNKQRADDEEEDKASREVRTIYRTLSADFDGDIAGYSTLAEDTKPTQAVKPKVDDDDESSSRPKPKATATSTEEESSTAEQKKAKQTESETEMPTAIKKPTVTSIESSVLVKETGEPSATAPLHTANEADITSAVRGGVSSTSSADSSASSSDADAGASAGAKAGIAFGVLGGLLVIGLIVFFIFNRRKKQARERLGDDDEKLHEPAGDAAFAGGVAASSNPRAPRLSLRPVTQFFPGFNAEKRSSKGAAMTLAPSAAAGVGAGAITRGGPWDRPSTSQSTHSANPFGNHAERAPSPISEEHSMYNKPMPPSPMSDHTAVSDPFTANGPAIAGAAAAGAGATALARKTSMRRDGPNRVDLTVPPALSAVPPSPSGTEFSDSPETPGLGPAPTAGAAAIAAAGGPANTGVHRVQLDFNSTLEDEMDLKAGQLVRLLHEYDDGWALCIRLDRSQQGVVPRTCLSTRPVKPRPPPGAQRPGPPVNPQGPPRGPPRGPGHPRGPPPNGMGPQGRPRGASGAGPGPNGGRPMSPFGPGPNARSQSPMGRPMGSPNAPGQRSQSPGPRMQGPPGGRSQSPSGMSRRMSPPGPSPMNQHQRTPSGPINRKPVPGQAL